MAAKKKKQPEVHYGILYIPFAKFLITSNDYENQEELTFPSKELAQFWMSSISAKGFRLKHGVKMSEVRLQAFGMNKEDSDQLHNHICDFGDDYTKHIEELNNSFDVVDCLKISGEIMYPTFDSSQWDDDIRTVKTRCHDISSCCDLYDKNHFEIVEIKNRTKTYTIPEQEAVAKSILKLLKTLRGDCEDLDIEEELQNIANKIVVKIDTN